MLNTNERKTILNAFIRGERLTVAEAMSKYNVYVLREIVRDLKRAGYNIESEWETCLNTHGTTSRYKRYWMVENNG